MSVELTIFIPIFNQPEKLIKCLHSLRSQTFKKFIVFVVDDNSTLEYIYWLKEYEDLEIKYIKNENRLGAFSNILNCLHLHCDTRYRMVLHEDDILSPQWLEYSLQAFKIQQDNVAWVGCEMDFFSTYDEINFELVENLPHYILNNFKLLVKKTITGSPLSFSSIIYDNSKLQNFQFCFNKYSVLGDRIFLFELGKEYGFIYFQNKFISVYDHSKEDNRWNELRFQHIIDYFIYLRSILTRKDLDDKLIKSFIMKSLREKIKFLKNVTLFQKFKIFMSLFSNDMFFLKYYLLTNKVFRKMSDFILIKN
jgi:glycosyltransferase involved in cell wall biosynthesis